MALVNEHQRVVGKILEQGRRRLAGFPPGEIARIVLDPGADAGSGEHFEIEHGALLEALRFQKAIGAVQLVEAELQLAFDAVDRLMQRGLRRDVVGVGVNLHRVEIVEFLAGERVEFVDRLDFVAE